MNSIVHIDATTLGSGKRSVYDRQLSNAGAAALADAMLLAAARGDRDLFAAANARAGTLPKGQKDMLGARIDVRATADLLAGDDLAEAAGVSAALFYFATEASFESAKLEGRETNAQDRVSVGLARREVEALAPDLLKEPDPTDPVITDPPIYDRITVPGLTDPAAAA